MSLSLICVKYLEFLDHAASLTGGKGLSLLQLDGDFADLNLELLAQSLGTLVVLLLLTEFISKTEHLSVQAVSAVLSGLKLGLLHEPQTLYYY